MPFSLLPTQFLPAQSPSFSSPSFQSAARSFTKFTALFSERFSEALTLLVERYPIAGRVSLKIALPIALIYGVCAIAILALVIRENKKKPSSTPTISFTPPPKPQPSPTPRTSRGEKSTATTAPSAPITLINAQPLKPRYLSLKRPRQQSPTKGQTASNGT